MSNINRPLSPHLQVYKPQMTSTLSILNRITGAALAVGAIFLTYYLYAAFASPECFAKLQEFCSGFIGKFMLFGWLFSFVYHMLNGVRHLKWDAGFGLDLKSAYRSGWATIIGTILLTLLIWTAVK